MERSNGEVALKEPGRRDNAEENKSYYLAIKLMPLPPFRGHLDRAEYSVGRAERRGGVWIARLNCIEVD